MGICFANVFRFLPASSLHAWPNCDLNNGVNGCLIGTHCSKQTRQSCMVSFKKFNYRLKKSFTSGNVLQYSEVKNCVPCSDVLVNGLTTNEIKLSVAEFSLTYLCSIDYSQLTLVYLHFAKLTINRSRIRLNSVLKIILDAVYLEIKNLNFYFSLRNWTSQCGTLDVQQRTL